MTDEDHSLSDMRVWDCWFEDLPEMVFHVTSSWSGGDNFPAKAGYSLSSDLKFVLWDYYLEEYQSGGGSLSCWAREQNRLTLTYSTLAETETAADQLQDFHDWWGRQSHGEVSPLSVTTEFAGGPLPVPPGLQETIYIDRITPENTFNFDSTREFMLGTSRYILLYYYGYYNLPVRNSAMGNGKISPEKPGFGTRIPPTRTTPTAQSPSGTRVTIFLWRTGRSLCAASGSGSAM